jgi:hypothetical protein
VSIETAVRGLLIADPTLSALVDVRVYPTNGVPQGAATPYGVYEKAARQWTMTYGGPVATARYTMDLTFWSASYGEAQACASAAMAKMLGYSGQPGGLAVLGAFDAGENDDQEIPQHAEEHGLVGASLSLDLWYRDS